MIDSADVWNWLGPDGDRSGDPSAANLMDRVVDAVEQLWLDRWSVLIHDDEGDLPDPRPDYIDQALIMQSARLYTRRHTPGGVAGVGDLGVVRVTRFDPDVEATINDGSWGIA